MRYDLIWAKSEQQGDKSPSASHNQLIILDHNQFPQKNAVPRLRVQLNQMRFEWIAICKRTTHTKMSSESMPAGKGSAELFWLILCEVQEMAAYSISRLSSLRLNYVSETSVRLHRSKQQWHRVLPNLPQITKHLQAHTCRGTCGAFLTLKESSNARTWRKASQDSAHGN